MAMVKPIGLIKNAFDATEEEIFEFTSKGGNQIVKNKLVIRKQSDNSVVYENIKTTYELKQTLPSNTLTNGEYYNYYFITYDVNNEASDPSNPIAFRCYSTPIVEYTNMPTSGLVESATYNFTFKYTQIEGELFDYIIVNLYSQATDTIVQRSEEIYYQGSNNIEYTFTGLEDNSNYYLKLQGKTVENTIFESVEQSFEVRYTTPILYSKLELYNKCDQGYVQVQTNLVIADGEAYPNPPTFYDDTLIDVSLNHYVQWLSGYDIPKDFVLEIWGSPSLMGEFCTLWNDNNDSIKLNFVREIPYGYAIPQDYFTVIAEIDGEEMVYAHSNYVNLMNCTTQYVAWVKKIDNVWELVLNIVSQENNYLRWNEESNVKFNSITNIMWVGEENGYVEGDDKEQIFEDIDIMFPITHTRLQNGVYDQIDINTDTSKSFSADKATWGYYTQLNCDFENNVRGGNVNIILSQLSAIRIKRRAKGSLKWITLKDVAVTSEKDLDLNLQDSLVPSGVEQEYAIVPILEGGIEGEYIISEITPKWDGVFVTSEGKIFKLYNAINYSGFVNTKQIGSVMPLGSQYPYITQNANTRYMVGTISGTLLGYQFEKDKTIDRNSVVIQTNDFLDIMSNGSPICITDWNGNIWLGTVTSNEPITYDAIYGNGIATVSFSFAEQGKYDNQDDLYNNGFADVR